MRESLSDSGSLPSNASALTQSTGRPLLYGMKTSGDGNFHLQRRYNSSKETTSDSLVGDAGFWAVQSEFENYAEATNAFKDLPGRVRQLFI